NFWSWPIVEIAKKFGLANKIANMNSIDEQQDESLVEQYESPVEQYESPVEQYESLVEQYESPVEQYESPVEQDESPVELDESPVELDESPLTCLTPIEVPYFSSHLYPDVCFQYGNAEILSPTPAGQQPYCSECHIS
ncbi:17747_t:CDS:2, partial [Gigaspora rosea]